ncbi:maternal protein exuperantia [Anabrus simplex]|uniref:maternal protein exuperantia n=1 Tax=Anabrus simplex TaxID=316456 RepID=UPI0034DD582F
MVSTVVKENGTEGVKPSNFPQGDYILIGWDVDTTGRRLIDEICQIAAYTPNNTFSQYVMPFRELNPAARRRHNIRVVTIGRFRMLKDNKSGKVLKTKSEISALTDFIQWLETVRGKTGDGVILVSHEGRKVAAPLLLEALRKYNLLDKFSSVVKGFCNSFSVAEYKCAKSVRSFSLRTLSRVLLDREENLNNATDRARLAYQIVQHLCGSDDRQGSGDAAETTSPAVVQAVIPFAHTISDEEQELAGLKVVVERQNSLRPVFRPMMLRERQRAMNLRRMLAEAGINYDDLSSAYKQNGDEGLKELLNKLPRVKPKEFLDLQTILHEHFNPDAKQNSENKPQKNKTPNKSGGGDASGSTTPETAPNSPVKVPSSSPGTTNANSPPSNGNDSSPQKPSSPGEVESTSPTTTTNTTTTTTSPSVPA